MIRTLFLILCLFAYILPSHCQDSLSGWHLKDWEQDKVPGISLERAYAELLQDKQGQEVVVAILDTKIDTSHEELQGMLWTNTDEIPDNGIDDDGNGYIDDVHGWNFLGNAQGEDILYEISEPARYARLLQQTDTAALKASDPKRYATLVEQSKIYEEERAEFMASYAMGDSIITLYDLTISTISPLLGSKMRDSSALDSLGKQREELQPYIGLLRDFVIPYGLTDEDIEWSRNYYAKRKDFFYNSDYNEREITGDNPQDINDRFYGNGIINGRVPFEHAIEVAGVLAAKRNNGKGLDGVSDYIRLMPVVMVADGEEYDKDVALAIRYAVDNGAQIINMSWGKTISIHPEWVRKAIAYATENNVLLVTSSGNDAANIDKADTYPNDYTEKGEFSNSFITVGALAPHSGPDLVASFSNYGAENVDLFAPGKDILTTQSENGYDTSSGTSLAAPLVSGTAALLLAYYPELTAAELKEILLESATRLEMDVYQPNDDDEAEKELVPFSSLSKTGGILNAYNALKLAASKK